MNICPNVRPTRNSTSSRIEGARFRNVDCSRGRASVRKRIDRRTSPLREMLARKRASTGREMEMEGFLWEWGARGKPDLLRVCSGMAARLVVNGSVMMTLEVARHGPETQRRSKWLIKLLGNVRPLQWLTQPACSRKSFQLSSC